MEPESLSFEEAYTRLEEIVQQLESDDLPIDRAVELYEAGVRLVRQCNARLNAAELRVSQLTAGDDGELRLAPFAHPN